MQKTITTITADNKSISHMLETDDIKTITEKENNIIEIEFKDGPMREVLSPSVTHSQFVDFANGKYKSIDLTKDYEQQCKKIKPILSH